MAHQPLDSCLKFLKSETSFFSGCTSKFGLQSMQVLSGLHFRNFEKKLCEFLLLTRDNREITKVEPLSLMDHSLKKKWLAHVTNFYSKNARIF